MTLISRLFFPNSVSKTTFCRQHTHMRIEAAVLNFCKRKCVILKFIIRIRDVGSLS